MGLPVSDQSVCLTASQLARLLLDSGAYSRVVGPRVTRAGARYFVVMLDERPRVTLVDAARNVVRAWPRVTRAVAGCDGETYQQLLGLLAAAGLVVWEKRAGVAPRAQRSSGDAAALWLSRLLRRV